MTAADMPAPESRLVDLGEGEVNFKWAANNIMASVGDKVLYKGHPVAAVAAIDRYAAMEALKSIIVKYEVLTPVTNVKEAMSPGAPILIPELKGDDLGQTVTNTNVATHLRRDLGDIDNGFQLCTHTIEREYSLRTVHQGYIEPHTATALWDEEGRIKVWTSTQGAFTARSQIAGLLEIGESRVRVYPLEIGGGFGGKINVYLEPLAAILSRKSGGRPVKLVMERTEVFEASGPAPGGVVKVKIGTDGGGRLIAATADINLKEVPIPARPFRPPQSVSSRPTIFPICELMPTMWSSTSPNRRPIAPRVRPRSRLLWSLWSMNCVANRVGTPWSSG